MYFDLVIYHESVTSYTTNPNASNNQVHLQLAIIVTNSLLFVIIVVIVIVLKVSIGYVMQIIMQKKVLKVFVKSILRFYTKYLNANTVFQNLKMQIQIVFKYS